MFLYSMPKPSLWSCMRPAEGLRSQYSPVFMPLKELDLLLHFLWCPFTFLKWPAGFTSAMRCKSSYIQRRIVL